MSLLGGSGKQSSRIRTRLEQECGVLIDAQRGSLANMIQKNLAVLYPWGTGKPDVEYIRVIGEESKVLLYIPFSNSNPNPNPE
jgi:hypothetical protein